MGNKADENSLRNELDNRANEVFSEMLNFDPPSVGLLEKSISPKNVADPRRAPEFSTVFVDEGRQVPDRRPNAAWVK